MDMSASAPASGPASALTDARTQNLITLSEMGFFDAKLNGELLDTLKDNVELVIANLLIKTRGR
jgi:hypothetical protein